MNGEAYITAEEMAALDENCGFYGLIPLQLMENAGAQLAMEIRKLFGDPKSRNKRAKVTILAGKGNNGGDAFVAARYLHGKPLLSLSGSRERGRSPRFLGQRVGAPLFDVKILLIGHSQDLRTEEARRNWQILKECGFNTEEITDSSNLKAASTVFSDSDVIVDAIFGTGVRGTMREPEATAIDLINGAKPHAIVVAVDIPSGLNPDTGEAETAVKADLTVTFHKAKQGLLRGAAADYVGELVVADIGIPEAMEQLAGPGDVRRVLKRNARSHKGDNGRVLIVGGGPFFGAPTLAALAALRAGADWVTIAAPQSVSAIISSLSPNLIVHPLSSDVLTEKDVSVVVDLVKRHDVLVIGMGLGTAEETKRATRLLIENEASKNVVVDADGFYGLQLPVEAANKNVIVTPHAGEFLKMNIAGNPGALAVPPEDIMGERMHFVKEFSERNNVVTLMKGPTDIISDGHHVKLNKTGNAGMTVGGTGDVLAGLVGAFFAVTTEPFKAATAAAFVNGVAGDLAFEEKGYGLLATDVLERVPKVTRAFR